MSRRLARGQSVAEAAICLLVFVTVLMFGIHFAEVGYLSIKVQEAANSALWDTTSKKMHKTETSNWRLYKRAIEEAGPEATLLYEDHDGRASQDQGALTLTHVFTRAGPIEVDCTRQDPGEFPTFEPLGHATAAIDAEQTGMRCSATAELSGWRMPRFLLENDQEGFFQKQHWEAQPIPICAASRATAGRCTKGYVLSLDDWGYAGKEERGECALNHEGGTGCGRSADGQNRGYYTMVERMYGKLIDDEGGGRRDSASDLARFTTGRSPIDENHFYMSFRGSQSEHGPYTEDLRQSHRDREWETTPFKRPREFSSKRDRCWLGHDCP